MLCDSGEAVAYDRNTLASKNKTAKASLNGLCFICSYWRTKKNFCPVPLGKGEVVSSILTGSTGKAAQNRPIRRIARS
jgi:hypothetical protein